MEIKVMRIILSVQAVRREHEMYKTCNNIVKVIEVKNVDMHAMISTPIVFNLFSFGVNIDVIQERVGQNFVSCK